MLSDEFAVEMLGEHFEAVDLATLSELDQWDLFAVGTSGEWRWAVWSLSVDENMNVLVADTGPGTQIYTSHIVII